MELQAIKTDRLYVKVAAQLSKLVSDGIIVPGDRLPSERELAEKLNVSRPTIREAMIALELSGIVEIRTGSGIFVNEKKPFITSEDKGVGPFEILQIRGIIESEACSIAAKHISDEQIKQLKDTIVEMEEEEKRPDSSEKADWKFHSIIADATQNSAITSIVNWLWELRSKSDLSSAFAQRLRAEGVHPSIQDHTDIVEALEKRDAEQARIAMKKHIENATEAAATYFDNDPFSNIKL
ncbi:FadR/GntR family transcriptional regulator [Shewanella sp. UCD-KL21]|uniref:FadR/GntR family transcriptional regulator n=1 Tax=Shewanella sp. UCD-KL21 TaxID=1917164 RepID=UPI000970826A|nr:FadR/GntR family transcriptional regulator [Shewanella sp. UCD-KL21]